jgi:hypothetical protein
MNEVRTYEWMNVTLISHLLIKLCVKRVFNAWYQWVKFTNYEWMNFAQFSLLNCEMLNLRPQELLKMNQIFISFFNVCYITIHRLHENIEFKVDLKFVNMLLMNVNYICKE